MNKARRRRNRKRKAVDRFERVPPTPETLAKLKPWTMSELLRLGPDAGGIDHEQYEAAIEIVDAYAAITRELGYRPTDLVRVGKGQGGMSPRDLRLSSIYLRWADDIEDRLRIRAPRIVGWIEDHDARLSLGDLPALLVALDRWGRVKLDHDKARPATVKTGGNYAFSIPAPAPAPVSRAAPSASRGTFGNRRA